MSKYSERLCQWVCGAVAAFALASAAHAGPIGLIILEGSDAQTFHGLEPYSTNFQTGLQTYSSAPTLGVLAVGPFSSPVGSAPAGETVVTSLGDLAGLGKTLMDFSGVYFMSPFTCCDENSSVMFGFEADILAFHTAGRSIGIEDYTGGAGWDFLLGTSGGANAHVAGYGGGTSGLGSCFDGNFLTPTGAAFGLGAVAGALPNISCFGHQAYEASFFDALGFTSHLADNPALNGYNVVISNGGGGLAEAAETPEPGTLSLFALAALCLVQARRRKSA